MTAIQVLDSHLRCPRCHKRMVMQIGQDESGMRAEHECFGCGYTETDRQWTRPLTQLVGTTQAERLKRLRLEGTVMAIEYDTTPFPEEWADV